MNKWIKKSKTGTFTFGGMTPAVMTVDLPARYKILKGGDSSKIDGYYFCTTEQDPNGELLWKGSRTIEVRGVKKKLIRDPRFCTGRWTVFATEVDDECSD